MASPRQRRLRQLAVDAAGYSRLMGADEEGPCGAQVYRREIIDPKIRNTTAVSCGSSATGRCWNLPA